MLNREHLPENLREEIERIEQGFCAARRDKKRYDVTIIFDAVTGESRETITRTYEQLDSSTIQDSKL